MGQLIQWGPCVVDRGVKAVVTQLAMVNGWDNANRLISSDVMPQLIAGFQAGKLRDLFTHYVVC
jgi:hypothetical protein